MFFFRENRRKLVNDKMNTSGTEIASARALILAFLSNSEDDATGRFFNNPPYGSMGGHQPQVGWSCTGMRSVRDFPASMSIH